MIPTSFAAIIILAATGLIFHSLFRSYFRTKFKKRHLQIKGVEADAILLNWEQTGVYINSQPQVKLQMQVQPRTGRNFVTETREVVSSVELGRLCIGRVLRVRYNPADTRELEVLQGEGVPFLPPA